MQHGYVSGSVRASFAGGLGHHHAGIRLSYSNHVPILLFRGMTLLTLIPEKVKQLR